MGSKLPTQEETEKRIKEFDKIHGCLNKKEDAKLIALTRDCFIESLTVEKLNLQKCILALMKFESKMIKKYAI